MDTIESLTRSSSTTLIEQQFNARRNAYVRQLPDKMYQLLQTWRQLIMGRWTNESFKTLHDHVHGLAVSTEGFGLLKINELARATESYIKPLVESDTPPSDAELLKVNALLGELKKTGSQLGRSNPVIPRSTKLHPLIRLQRA